MVDALEGVGVLPHMGHAGEGVRLVDPRCPAHRQGQGHVLPKIIHDGIPLRPGLDDEHSPSARHGLLHPRRHVRLTGEQVPLVGAHGEEGVADLLPGLPHHVRMVRPHVGDDSQVRPQHVLRGPLALGMDGHALHHQHLGPLPAGEAHHAGLLPDVGGGAALYLLLMAVHMEDHGQGAGGLGEHPDAAAPQSRVDEPDRGGLAPDAVHMDHMNERTPTPAKEELLPRQV